MWENDVLADFLSKNKRFSGAKLVVKVRGL